MKCGTTSLFNSLDQHPEIAGCRYKEPRFFTKDFHRGYDYYQSLWDWNPQQHKVAIEATPGYTKINNEHGINAAENIALIQQEHQANFKFIYMMRHPLERIESHYIHDILRSKKHCEGLVSEVKQEIIDTSKYALQISEFYRRFPAENILLINFEDLKSNPRELLRKTCQFLEIDDDFDFAQTQVKHNSRQGAINPIPGWHKLRNAHLLKYLLSNISSRNKQVLKQIFSSKQDLTFEFDPKLKQDILKELKPDLLELQNKYQFDFQNWQLNLKQEINS